MINMSSVSQFGLYVPPVECTRGNYPSAVRSTRAPLLHLLLTAPRCSQGEAIKRVMAMRNMRKCCLVSVQPQQFCSWISDQNCNRRECQAWVIWWTHPGRMLREYQEFLTPTQETSLVYLRIEEYLRAHLFLPLAAWKENRKKSSRNAKSGITN